MITSSKSPETKETAAVTESSLQEPSAKRRKIAAPSAEQDRVNETVEEKSIVKVEVTKTTRAKRKFAVNEDEPESQQTKGEQDAEDSFVAKLSSKRDIAQKLEDDKTEDEPLPKPTVKRIRGRPKASTTAAPADTVPDEEAGDSVPSKPAAKRKGRPKKQAAKPRAKETPVAELAEGDAPDVKLPPLEEAERQDEQPAEKGGATKSKAGRPTKKVKGTKVEEAGSATVAVEELQGGDPAVPQPAKPQKATRRQKAASPLIAGDIEPQQAIPAKSTRKRKATAPPPNEEDAQPEDPLPTKRSRKKKAVSPYVDDAPAVKEVVVTEDAVDRKTSLSPRPPLQPEQEVLALPKKSREREAASPAQAEYREAEYQAPVKKAGKTARKQPGKKAAKLDFTPPRLSRRPLQETDPNQSPSPKKSPNKESDVKLGKQKANAGKKANEAFLENDAVVADQKHSKKRKIQLDEDVKSTVPGTTSANSNIVEEAEDKVAERGPAISHDVSTVPETAPLVAPPKKATKPRTTRKKAEICTDNVAPDAVDTRPIAAKTQANSSQEKIEDEDVDWLLAPAVPPTKPKTTTNKTGQVIAKGRSDAGRKTKMADMDLDDLLASVATFAMGGSATAGSGIADDVQGGEKPSKKSRKR